MLKGPLFGFVCLAVLFFICFFLVIGVKYFYLWFFSEEIKPEPKKPTLKKRKKRKQRLRSIEINPDEIDRIYFGKY